MKKILYLNPASELGGAERSLLGLLSKLDRKRFYPFVVCPKDGPLIYELNKLNVSSKVIKLPRIALKVGRSFNLINFIISILAVFSQIPFFIKLLRFTKKERFDIIHTNGIKSHLHGCVIARITGARLIWHIRDFLQEGILKYIFIFMARRYPSVVITNSNAVLANLIRDEKVRAVTIYNGIDLEEFRPEISNAKIRKELNLNDSVPIVGILSILAPWKGHKVFLKAVTKVIKSFPNVKFLIAGDEIYDTFGHKNYRKELEDFVSELKLNDYVIFLGFRRDIADVINSIDVVVHASVLPEPFGRVLIEAMACEKVVVAVNSGGVPEVVIDGKTGILIPPNDEEKMAEAIMLLLGDKKKRIIMGKMGREHVEKYFSISNIVKEIEKLYDSL